MIELNDIQTLVMHLAEGGIAAPALRREVKRLHPEVSDSHYWSLLLSLQNQRRLFGDEITGVWVFTSVSDEEINNHPLEYSPQFAELITAAECGEWREIDADDLIAELDAMLMKARALKKK